MPDSQIESAALVVAQAKARADAAQEATDGARGARDNLVGRLGDLETQHTTLVQAARVKGADQPGIALKLAVLDADIADLKPLVAEAEAALQQAETALTAARQGIVTAEQHLAIAADIDLQVKLETAATDLAARLWQAVEELRQVWARRNARATWFPDDLLVRELQILQFAGKGMMGIR